MKKIVLSLAAIVFAFLMSNCTHQVAQESQSVQYPIAHHVFFWFNDPDDAEARIRFENAVTELLQIPEIKAYHVGIPAPVEERPVIDASYTYSYLVFFESVEGHDIYQAHPIHEKFVEENKDLWAKVQVYDSQLK
jgi:hypothetical protein